MAFDLSSLHHQSRSHLPMTLGFFDVAGGDVDPHKSCVHVSMKVDIENPALDVIDQLFRKWLGSIGCLFVGASVRGLCKELSVAEIDVMHLSWD